jgi:hypothetical protein
MTESSTPAPEPGPATNPPGPARTARQGLVAGLAVGLLVGGGGVGLAWAFTSGASDDAAQNDAAAACMAIEESEVPSAEDDELPLDLMRRWAGAGELAGAAAEADSGYQSLADELETVSRGIATFEFDQVEEAAQNAKDLCADL